MASLHPTGRVVILQSKARAYVPIRQACLKRLTREGFTGH